MAKDFWENVKPAYDVVVVGSGLAGMTAANTLAKLGRSVLLCEHHYQLGGLATSFKRKGGHIFDISLHGFPVGMVKSCRRYWTKEIADSIVQLHRVRFVNPQFDLETTFTREDFTRILIEQFNVAPDKVNGFYEALRKMNYYDNDRRTTRELFEEYFPNRSDVHRLLLEPIAYANGSTLEDPAITYGIVFSNFMSKGVYIYRGGTDRLIALMRRELIANGVDVRTRCAVEKVCLDSEGKVAGVIVNGRPIACKTVLSNANIKNTLFDLVGKEHLDPSFAAQAEAVRNNTSSCQVYLGIKEGESIPNIGDLVFSSQAPEYSSGEITDFHTTSRTFSLYYPDCRPQRQTPHYAVVASINAKWADWANLSDEEYAFHKNRIIEESVQGLEKFIPNVRQKIDWTEAATPRTIHRYVRHREGTSFGTKFEGLKVSMEIPEHIPGLYHAGSVGIIMSGWLGTINYGVIASGKLDSYLRSGKSGA